ncbi:hypothetical protein TYRP_007704 [Tyrophagus putrescentiae]|nr:hypothetical protein TYRP_007704 [Tyrophagus putrescentiae]
MVSKSSSRWPAANGVMMRPPTCATMTSQQQLRDDSAALADALAVHLTVIHSTLGSSSFTSTFCHHNISHLSPWGIEQNMMTNDSDSASSETEKLPLVDLTQPGPSHTATEAVVPLITLEDTPVDQVGASSSTEVKSTP